MAILPYNVNVMDSQGLILGSGEPERVNTRHEGAQLVLANGRVVEIDAQTAIHLKGVQPGINLPLMLDQRLIGVLGITGEPEQLRTYAELVRMTAEMLVGQRNQQAETAMAAASVAMTCWRCCSVMAGHSPRLDRRSAQQLGLKPQMTRVPYLFELGQEHGAGQHRRSAQCLADRPLPGQLVREFGQVSLLWCRPASQSRRERAIAGQTRRPGLEHPAHGRGRAGRWAGGVAAAAIAGSATCWPTGARCCRTPVC